MTRDLIDAIDRLAGAIERLATASQATPEPATVECIRCAGKGRWGPYSPCTVCDGAGVVPA